MNNTKGLIFDLDGVIVSTEKNHFEAWKKAAELLNIPFNEHDNEKLKGISRVDSLKELLKIGNLSVSEEKFNEVLTFKNDEYFKSIQKINENDLLRGTKQLLIEAKKSGLKLAIGSSSKNARFILDLLGITSFFDVIVDGNMVVNPKPNPEVFVSDFLHSTLFSPDFQPGS
jgi:beta-phosphoglucomutase